MKFMPLYAYACPVCESKVDEQRSIETRHYGPTCLVCGETMVLCMSAPLLVFRGTGWRSPTTKEKIRQRAAEHAARGHQLPPKPTYRIRFPKTGDGSPPAASPGARTSS